MHSLPPAVWTWLSEHHGVITVATLRSLGVSRRAWERLVAAHAFLPIHRGVFRIASAPDTLGARCVGLCAAHPISFITGPAGGRLTSLRRMPVDDGLIQLAVPHGSELVIDGVAVRQTRKFDRSDVQHRADGINIASPWRLAFDLAVDLDPLAHASVVEQILFEKRCGIAALIVAGRRLVHPARPGSAQFVATLAQRLPGGALESHREVELAIPLRARGIPVEAQTTWLDLPNGTRARLDLSVPSIRWGIEIDAHPDHFGELGGARDRQRDRQARQLGWQIDRVTKLDLLDLDSTLDELHHLYDLRCLEIARLNRPSA